MVNSEGHLKKKKSDTDTVLALHTFLGSKEAEKNRNEILVDLHHIFYNFLVLVPNSLPLTVGLTL